MKDQVAKGSTERSVENLKEAWVTPDFSDYQVEALTENFANPGAVDGGFYS